MKLNKLYLESIDKQPKHIREELLREAPHTGFSGTVPPELERLQARMVDLGFEDMGLSEESQSNLRRAFCGSGLRVPNTPYKLRCIGGPESVIEKSENREILLPEDWWTFVTTYDNDFHLIWIGDKVREDRRGKADLERDYHKVSDGWLHH
jgi:hypothetical protein